MIQSVVVGLLKAVESVCVCRLFRVIYKNINCISLLKFSSKRQIWVCNVKFL